MPCCLIALLAELFVSLREFQTVPTAWLPVRMAFLPKSDRLCPSVEDYRPLSIAVLGYRCYSKWLLATIPEAIFNSFPVQSAGGLPGRDACMAWFETAVEYETTMLKNAKPVEPLFGTAIDTYKFFDHIAPDDACLMLANLGVSISLIRSWRHWAVNQKALSFSGLCSSQAHCILKGASRQHPLYLAGWLPNDMGQIAMPLGLFRMRRHSQLLHLQP